MTSIIKRRGYLYLDIIVHICIPVHGYVLSTHTYVNGIDTYIKGSFSYLTYFVFPGLNHAHTLDEKDLENMASTADLFSVKGMVALVCDLYDITPYA